MRKLAVLCLILMPILFFSPVRAGADVDSLYDFMESVRTETGIDSSAAILTDAMLINICQRAIHYTSTDIGGVESFVPIVTVKHQKFYAVPDTVVEVIFQTLTIGKKTSSMLAWPPGLYGWSDFPPELVEDISDNDELTPGIYNLWADTIQLMPIPVRSDDTIYFKCFVEHPVVDADSSDVVLGGKYLEAAYDYTFHLVYRKMRQFDLANLYLGYYDKKKAYLKGKIAEQAIDNFKVAE